MSPSSAEELRFDFDDGVAAKVPSKEQSRPSYDDDDRDEAPPTPSPADLTARLAAVRAAARTAGKAATVLLDEQAPEELEDFDAPEGAENWDVDQNEAASELPESLTIAQFYERVRRALAVEFTDEVWVSGEIRGLRESRGHHYLELADHGAPVLGRGAGQALEVVCWAREWPPVARALAEAGLLLEVGQVVRVRGKVSVWEGGSKIRFTLTALDVEALLGQIAQARRRLLLALEAEGLLEANKRWPLALVPLRIGLVTSPSSEAHRDFVGQLQASGFAFQIRLEPSLVQGGEAPVQLAAAIRRLETFEPDLAVIVRGGGARGDLAAFDNEEVARAVAHASFPIWTGIGHTGDRSVVDEIAHASFITPTACGEAIVARVSSYWAEIARKTKTLSALASAHLEHAQQRLSSAERTLVRASHHQLARHNTELETRRQQLSRLIATRIGSEQGALLGKARNLVIVTRRFVDQHSGGIERRNQVLRAYDPHRQLARGWSLTRDANGRIVKSVSGLRAGEQLTTRFDDGEAVSRIEELVQVTEAQRPDPAEEQA